jgi:hypothetical protein
MWKGFDDVVIAEGMERDAEVEQSCAAANRELPILRVGNRESACFIGIKLHCIIFDGKESHGWVLFTDGASVAYLRRKHSWSESVPSAGKLVSWVAQLSASASHPVATSSTTVMICPLSFVRFAGFDWSDANVALCRSRVDPITDQ